MKIGIINIGIGNVNSVARAFEKLGAKVSLVSTASEIASSQKLVFPGVGNYGEATSKIDATGIRQVLREEVLANRKPILGICLGMQLLGLRSEEGNGDGLGLISAEVYRLKSREYQLPIPHVGWNDVIQDKMEMFNGIPPKTSFYFVHSYAIPSEQTDCEIASCSYGEVFAAALQHKNIWGVQFHPEKSQEAGLRLLKNFIDFHNNA